MYSFSLSFLLVVVPGVILAFTNVYVFISARKRYSIRKSRGKQTAKRNRVFPAQAPETSRKNISSESRVKILTDTPSSDNTIDNQSAVVTRDIHPDASSNFPNLKVAGFENQALCQKRDYHC